VTSVSLIFIYEKNSEFGLLTTRKHTMSTWERKGPYALTGKHIDNYFRFRANSRKKQYRGNELTHVNNRCSNILSCINHLVAKALDRSSSTTFNCCCRSVSNVAASGSNWKYTY